MAHGIVARKMKAQLDEISPKAARGGAHAALVLDPAGWHTTDKPKVPRNITVRHCHVNVRAVVR